MFSRSSWYRASSDVRTGTTRLAPLCYLACIQRLFVYHVGNLVEIWLKAAGGGVRRTTMSKIIYTLCLQRQKKKYTNCPVSLFDSCYLIGAENSKSSAGSKLKERPSVLRI